MSKIKAWMLFTSAFWRGDHHLIWPKSWKWSWHCLTAHGQASIGRGFSINKSLLVENLHKESLTAQHIVYDHMKVNDLEAHEIPISPILRHSVKSSRQKYSIFLEEQKKKAEKAESSRKRSLIEEEMIELKRRKSLLVTTISSLNNDANKFANEAEESDDLNIMKKLLTKSNSFCGTAKEKEAKFQEYLLQLKDLHKRKEL